MSEEKNLFRRNGKNVYIKSPEFHELSYVAKLWSDEETMKDIGGVYKFPEGKWEMFYKKMIYPTDGKNFYCLVYTIRDKAIGEVSFHGYDSATKIARFNLKIHHRYRNKGYGQEAIKLLLEYYFLQFGGEMIMDNVHTEEGLALADKLGFKAFRNYKGEATVRISKEEFLNQSKDSSKNVAIMIYEGMDFLEYSLTLSILKKANAIIDNEIFNVYGVGGEECCFSSSGVKVNRCLSYEESEKPDIIILPGAENVNIHVKDKEIIRYILTHYNNCDFVCGLSSSINILNRCRALEGVPVPNGKWIDSIENGRENLRVSNNSFVDNGKLMFSSNMAGNIDLTLNLIKKICGKNASDIVAKELGFRGV